MDSNTNHAIVRIDSDAPTMLDFLAQRSEDSPTGHAGNRKSRRRTTWRRCLCTSLTPGRAGGSRPRAADTHVARTQEVESRSTMCRRFAVARSTLSNAICRLKTWISISTNSNVAKQAEYEKLEAVIGFARTSGCRQRVILNYFGETGRRAIAAPATAANRPMARSDEHPTFRSPAR